MSRSTTPPVRRRVRTDTPPRDPRDDGTKPPESHRPKLTPLIDTNMDTPSALDVEYYGPIYVHHYKRHKLVRSIERQLPSCVSYRTYIHPVGRGGPTIIMYDKNTHRVGRATFNAYTGGLYELFDYERTDYQY